MRKFIPLLSLNLCASVAQAAGPCPSDLTAVCEQAIAVAADLSSAMPADLSRMRLDFAVAAGAGVIVIARPAIGGLLPDPGTAQTWLCATPDVPEFVAAGGTVKVLLIDDPFVTLTTCEAP